MTHTPQTQWQCKLFTHTHIITKYQKFLST